MVSNSPKVCVIMPVYNGAKTIKYALASLVRQTYKNWECIIVNDGSTDGTKAILDSLNDIRFKVYHLEKNSGRGIAREEALRHAQGKYLCYLDADDMLHEDKIRLQVEYLEQNPDILLVGCGKIDISENFDAQRASFNDIPRSNVYRYGQALPLTLPASMVRLDRALTFHYDSFLDVGEDYDYFSRYCDGGRYASLPVPYYYYMVGNVNARKLLYYQWNDIRGGIVRIKNGLILNGIYYSIIRFFKLIGYSILVSIFGPERIVGTIRKKHIDCDLQLAYDLQFTKIKEVISSSVL